MGSQQIYEFGDLTITKTKANNIKFLEVVKNYGDYVEILDPSSEDYHNAIILMLNKENNY